MRKQICRLPAQFLTFTATTTPPSVSHYMSSLMLRTAAAIHHSKSHIPPCPVHQCMLTLNRIYDTSPETPYTNPCHHQHHRPNDVNRNEQTRCAMQRGPFRVAAVFKNVQTIRPPATGLVPFIPHNR